jgi:hypothetical protein
MHPYSLPELGYSELNLKNLMAFGGFPEPLIDQSERTIKRWHIQRIDRLVKLDLRDLSLIRDLEKIHQLAEELPNRVGSPLSIKNLSIDLEVDHKTAKNWILTLEILYYCFTISPYGEPKIRAVKKEQKLYLWDWSQIEGAGIRFENMMACHLLKFCHFHEDVFGERMELRFIRDTDKREIDFVVLKNKKTLFAVECKLKNDNLSPHIKYMKERTKVPMFYQVHLEGQSKNITDQIKILNFIDFCKEVSLV